MIVGYGPQLDALRLIVRDVQPHEVCSLGLEHGATLRQLAAALVVARCRALEERQAATAREMTLEEYHAETDWLWREEDAA